ncbi:hypothetical protein [Streptomyces capoamus]|uniref:hypothetical protein n=1 Tax=Streptomyces capoamus TaxID=68183 RepID=UPI00339B91A2
MTAQPDADELAVRNRLRIFLHGPVPQPQPPAVSDPDDWWDRLYDDEPTKPGKGSTPSAPSAAPPTARVKAPASSKPSPRQSLLDAWAGISPRLRWLIYHGTAAALGWGLGLTGWATQCTAWIAADRWANPQSIACYALGLGGVALHRRSRGWWWPVAWLATVPASAIVLGVLLYAPNS